MMKEKLFEMICEIGQLGIKDLMREVEEETFWIDNIDDLTEEQAVQVMNRIREIKNSYMAA